MSELERVALDDEHLERLLAPAQAEARAALVASLGLATPAGLAALLATATKLVPGDPVRGGQLAALTAEAAAAAGQPLAETRALYLVAQAQANTAEFTSALALIRRCRAAFEAMGEPLEALRTNLGLMVVLREQGRYQEALDAAEEVAAALERAEETATTQTLRAMLEESRGSIYEELGRYEEALADYAAAEASYCALDLKDRIGAIRNNRGVVLLALGRGREALAAFEEAAAILASPRVSLPHAQTLLNIGGAHLLLGAYSRALTCFEQARHAFAELDALAETPALLLDTADVYLALNLYPEAVATYGEADALLRGAGAPRDSGRARWGLGAALAAAGRLDEAEAALADAAALFRAADNLPLLSGVLLEQASLHASHGRHGAALATSRAAHELIDGHHLPIQQVYARLRLADLVLPDQQAAAGHLDAARAAADALGLPHLRYRVLQRLGHLHRLQGRPAEALALLEAAIDTIEGLRGTLPFEAVRASFLHDKVAAYEELVLLHLEATDPEGPRRAFAAAERAKSRSLVDLLAGDGEARSLEGDDPALTARLATLQADLNAIYLELLGGAPDTGHRADPAALRARAAELEGELSLLRLRLATPHGPDSTRAPQLQVAAGAPSTVPLLAYHLVGDEVIAFVCAGGEVRAVRRLCQLGQLQRQLRRLGDQWDRFRVGPAFVAQHLELLTRTTRHVLNDLYHCLIGPLEELLPAGKAPIPLAIVPHGLLHQVPFHALFDGERYLIDRYAISYGPSATVLELCATRQPRGDGPELLVGVADRAVPAVAAEIGALSQLMPGALVVRDEEATREAVSRLAAGCSRLHLACHGLFRADNPLYSALRLGDGWLTAADVLNLELDGALVVLSACESGRGVILGGDEVIGLTRSFLGAGASTLVVSLWLVQDEAAAALMGDWYARLATGQGRAAALRDAQLALRAAYPHPYYWSPFLLIGHP